MSFIEFSHVNKIYHMGDSIVKANDDVNFTIDEGEFVVVVGPSGAGKTTILNILGGMDTCTDGKVKVGDKIISSFKEKDLTLYRRNDVGFVFLPDGRYYTIAVLSRIWQVIMMRPHI